MTPETITILVAIAGAVLTLGGLVASLFVWLRADMHRTRDELKGDMHRTRDDLKGDMHRIRDELKADVKALDDKIVALDVKVSDLGERVARVEGKLDFLEAFITRRNEPPLAPAE